LLETKETGRFRGRDGAGLSAQADGGMVPGSVQRYSSMQVMRGEAS
jgi:hypothetical protein